MSLRSITRILSSTIKGPHFVRNFAKTPNVCVTYPKIYTKTGDKGTSALFTGERRSKDDLIFKALGNTDELSCTIGLAAEFSMESHLPFVDQLHTIQCVLQDIGSYIATPSTSARQVHKDKTEFDHAHTTDLEVWIDKYTEELPTLSNFILPSGGKASTSLHLSRAVCRRAERSVVAVVNMGELGPEPVKYLNRLSDYLFTAARYAALKERRVEQIYVRPEKHEEKKKS